MLNEKLKNLPPNPGIYIYKDKNNNIIYIGKAKNLKKRISSYFNKNITSPKTKILVKNISKLDYIIVDNEIEALLLENKLIKKHKPKYNINLKDSKTYPYICITKEEIPKLITTRILNNKGLYFGPFTDSTLRRNLIQILTEIYKLITPKTFSNKSQLNYQIGLSPAKTLDKINKKEYLNNVKKAIQFLKGKNEKEVINYLLEKMHKASEQQNFELALKYREKIEKLKLLKEQQKVDLIKNYDQDIVLIQTNPAHTKSTIQILEISKGVITAKKDFHFTYFEDPLLENFIKLYYSKNSLPKEILLENQLNEKDLIEQYLYKIHNFKTKIIIPKKGEKLKLLKLAKKNLSINFQKDILKEIQTKLNLKSYPKIIECFDVSNLSTEFNVGAMTRFNNMQEEKHLFRKFQIKSFKGKNDDYKAMQEIIYRRYLMLIEKREKKEVNFPNLIIIDGGKAQLNAALNSLKKLNLTNKIDIISIAKGTKRDKNEIYQPNKETPTIFDNNSEMMLFLRKIRDSVHNYVINYNRFKRNQKLEKEFQKI